MPFYRYECKDCGEEFRVLMQNGSRAPVVCPKCGHVDVTKLLPRIGVIYRGSGYYNTDYRDRTGSTKRTAGGGNRPTSATSRVEE